MKPLSSQSLAWTSWISRGLLLTLVLQFLGCSTIENPWSSLSSPRNGIAQSIGSYSAGCLQGAVPLQSTGPGYHVMRLSRKRNYGHPALIHFIEQLGRQLQEKKLGNILVGDISQPRGGPLLSGHVSHQIGLDVDIWFWQPTPEKSDMSLEERETLWAQSMLMVNEEDGQETLNLNIWNKDKVQILKMASLPDEVERIFVHPLIKKHLCQEFSGEEWIGKVRPWWKHDDHFHVRLRCQAQDSECSPQLPLANGNGCDETLDRWFGGKEKEQEKLFSQYQRMKDLVPLKLSKKLPRLPASCALLLD